MTRVHRSEHQLSRSKRFLFWVILIALLAVTLEVISSIGISLLPRRVRRTSEIYAEQSTMIRALLNPSVPHHIETHPVLGWRYAANYKSQINQMNSVAVRSVREYAPIPTPNMVRVAAFGDSFVYGSEVDNADAWATLLETRNSDLEVLNYGVGGYGVDQAYLRYLLEGRTLSPHVVLIGFSPDDINRTVNVYRRFLNDRDSVLIKPRYILTSNGELSLLETPARGVADYARLLANPREAKRFAKHDHWYEPCVFENMAYDYSTTVRVLCTVTRWAYRKYLDPERPIKGDFYNENSSAFKIQVALFERFSEEVQKANGVPLVLILPDKRSVGHVRRGRSPIYEPLLRHLRERRIEYCDVGEGFREAASTGGEEIWFAPQGHYSRVGNEIVAHSVARAVRKAIAARQGVSPK